MEHPSPAAILSFPNPAIPGSFYYLRMTSPIDADADWTNPDFYGNPIVLLMNERTMSMPEFNIMFLRVAPNVVVVGTNSIGADGDVVEVPLPGGDILWYTNLGVFTPEYGQTQRTGLYPDIRVERTIQGITEGRDELIEAAIAHILDNS